MSAAAVLLREVERYCRQSGLRETRVGELAMGHSGFVGLLRKRGTLTKTSERRVRAFMERFPDGCSLDDARAWRVSDAPPNRSEAKRLRLAEQIAAEAEEAGKRRRTADSWGEPLAIARDPVAVVAKAALPGIGDAIALLQKRWPELWAEVIATARAQGRMPGELLIAAIEAGLEAA